MLTPHSHQSRPGVHTSSQACAGSQEVATNVRGIREDQILDSEHQGFLSKDWASSNFSAWGTAGGAVGGGGVQHLRNVNKILSLDTSLIPVLTNAMRSQFQNNTKWSKAQPSGFRKHHQGFPGGAV